jgi:hypothetical protein
VGNSDGRGGMGCLPHSMPDHNPSEMFAEDQQKGVNGIFKEKSTRSEFQ